MNFFKYCFLLLILFGLTAQAQKSYVWCPEAQAIKPRIGFLESQQVNLVVFDGRNITPKSKVECSGAQVAHALTELLRQAYPSIKFNVMPEAEYYKPSAAGQITLKIGIAAYQAGFGTDVTAGIGSVGGKFSYGIFATGQWHGLTSFYVQLFDKRQSVDKKLSQEISETAAKSNLWGYKSAKDCLFMSYSQANQKLLAFIESSLMD